MSAHDAREWERALRAAGYDLTGGMRQSLERSMADYVETREAERVGGALLGAPSSPYREPHPCDRCADLERELVAARKLLERWPAPTRPLCAFGALVVLCFILGVLIGLGAGAR